MGGACRAGRGGEVGGGKVLGGTQIRTESEACGRPEAEGPGQAAMDVTTLGQAVTLKQRGATASS